MKENGKNSSQCLRNKSVACQTLDYAVQGLNESNTVIEVYYPHNFSETVNLYSEVYNLTIMGVGESIIRIHCEHFGNGLGFKNQKSVTICGIAWINCASRQNFTAISTESFNTSNFIQIYSGLFFYNVTDLMIEKCEFSTQRGVALALFDVGGKVSIGNSNFTNNSIAFEHQCLEGSISSNIHCSPLGGGLYIELTKCGLGTNCPHTNVTQTVLPSNYLIDQCLFLGNDKSSAYVVPYKIFFDMDASWWPFGSGAGLATYVRGGNKNNHILIRNSMFMKNTAIYGGGVEFSLSGDTTDNLIELFNVFFSLNKASVHNGGAVHTIQYEGKSGNFHFKNCKFFNNSATSGGAGDHTITSSRSRTRYIHDCDVTTISYHNCTWYNNIATKTGAALRIANDLVTVSSTKARMYFENSVFRGNAILPPIGKRTIRYGQGTVYSLGIQMEFSGVTRLYANLGTAIAIISTEIILGGSVEFSHNEAFQGAGLFLDGVSWLTLRKGLNLTFHSNDAFEAGAAIYYNHEASSTFNISTTCFIQYEDATLPPSYWDINVSFSNNSAVSGGNAIFLTGSPDCYWAEDGFLFETSGGIFNFSENEEPVISTTVKNVSFNSDLLRVVEDYYIIDHMPGSELNIPLTVVDYFNSSRASATVDAKCFNYTMFMNKYYVEDYCSEGKDFRFLGSRVATFNNSLTGIILGGPQNNSDLLVVFKTLETQPLIFSLRINFTFCANGYVYNESTKFCDCYDHGNGIVRCFSTTKNNSTMIPCIRSGYWFGYISQWDITPHQIVCSSMKCRQNCRKRCMNLDSWCLLPSDSSDFCLNHHSGPLCSLCKPGYSLGYGGRNCINDKECNTKSTILIAVFISLFWTVVMIGLLLTFHLNIQIGSGYIYGFVYFFSVLPYISPYIAGDQNFHIFVAIFKGVAHLDPEFLCYTNLCFSSFTQIQMTFFRYCHPITIATIIHLLLFFNRRCCRSIFTQNSLIHILSLILLLAYTSLFSTSIDLIVPIFLKSHSTVFVKIQPNIKYGDPTQHLPYLIIAILVEIILVLPFSILLLLAPWLMRYHFFQRFKPFIDEYQACYLSKYRWFAGFYLINRHLLALTVSVFQEQSNVILSQQILNTTILLIHAYIQPYKERWLNLVDAVFLFNLTLLSFLDVPTTYALDESEVSVIRGARYILILIPCLYLIAVCSVIITMRFKTCYTKSRNKIRWSPFVSQKKAKARLPQAARHMPSQHTSDHRYTEITDECSVSVEMSLATRESLGTRNTRLVTYSPTSSLVNVVPAGSEEVLLIPPPSASSSLFRKVAGFLTTQVQYWRGHELFEDHTNDDVKSKEMAALNRSERISYSY